MYQVRIEPRWWERTIAVYIYNHYHDKLDVYKFDNGRVIGTKVDEGALAPEPTIILPSEMLKDLVDAAMEIVPPDIALQNHLKDVVTVRDRLLSIVERKS